MRVAIVVFDGFDEVDAFVPLGIVGRLAADGWRADLATPAARATSLNGVVVEAGQPLEYANDADAVVIGGGLWSRAIADDKDPVRSMLDRLRLDPLRQSIGAVGSGTLLLARLGLLGDQPVCGDPLMRPWLMQAGVRVGPDAFHARGPIATACGCLAAHRLAAWLLLRGAGRRAAKTALAGSAAAAGDADDSDDVDRLLAPVATFVPDALD